MFSKSIRKAVNQEHALGCAVACVAFRFGVSYRKALALFSAPSNAWTRGYYCEEIIRALERGGLSYRYAAFDPAKDPSHRAILRANGTIVFVEPQAAYPMGHYIIRHGGRWMNPWSNFPQMVPVEAGFQMKLPGRVSYMAFERE